VLEVKYFFVSQRRLSFSPSLLPSFPVFTNQQLLDQSIVLVNGVRIALNLQLVE